MRRLSSILAAALIALAPAEEPATVTRLVVGIVSGNDAGCKLTSDDGTHVVLLEPDSNFGGREALAALAGKRCAVIAEFPASGKDAKNGRCARQPCPAGPPASDLRHRIALQEGTASTLRLHVHCQSCRAKYAHEPCASCGSKSACAIPEIDGVVYSGADAEWALRLPVLEPRGGTAPGPLWCTILAYEGETLVWKQRLTLERERWVPGPREEEK